MPRGTRNAAFVLLPALALISPGAARGQTPIECPDELTDAPAAPSADWTALDVRVAKADEAKAGDALKLVTAGLQKTILENAIATYEDARKSFDDAEAAYRLYGTCANRTLGVGPGHVNTAGP